MRSVRDALHLVKDPNLHREATVFAAQEGQHARAHTEHFDLLRKQGYKIDHLLTRLNSRLDWVDRHLPVTLRVAVTAASEHITAVVAREILGREIDPFTDVDPRLRSLFRWHALEELEHKAVAFNVMKEANVSQPVRIAGALIAFLAMMMRWKAATRMLCKQDGLTVIDMVVAKRRAVKSGIDMTDWALLTRFFPYLLFKHHPDDIDDGALIAKVVPEFAHGVLSRKRQVA